MQAPGSRGSAQVGWFVFLCRHVCVSLNAPEIENAGARHRRRRTEYDTVEVTVVLRLQDWQRRLQRW